MEKSHISRYIPKITYLMIYTLKITYSMIYTQKSQNHHSKSIFMTNSEKMIFTQKAQFFTKDHIKA